jgi:RHS repeat-associated protein
MKSLMLIIWLLNCLASQAKYRDTETDLVYYGHRYYTTSTGRWVSRDPIGEGGGFNMYAFVQNSPIDLIDVNGLISFDWERFKSDFCPSCNGKPYNPFKRCCCDGKILSRNEIPTGIKICKATSPNYGVEHEWIEIDGWSAGFTGTADGNPIAKPGEVNIPDPYASTRPDKVCTEIEASPCNVNITALKDAIKKEAQRQQSTHGP